MSPSSSPLHLLSYGIFNMFRTPLAHEAKVKWYIDKNDAIDLLTTLSFIHRKLDKVVKIK
ncbi:TIGR02391 family protein [Crassaminicella thermophila]